MCGKNGKEPITIVEVEIRNFRRIKFARAALDKLVGLVRVTGPNKAGKTSLLNALISLFGGARAISDAPTINDTASADDGSFVRGLLSNGFTIKRTFTPATPKGALTITGPDGGRFGQAKLDEWLGKLAFDPLALYQLEAAKMAALFLSLAKDPDLPVRLPQLRQRRQEAYEARTPEIRSERAAKSVPEPEGERPELPDVSAEMVRLKELRVKHAEREVVVRGITDLEKLVDYGDENVQRLKNELSEAEFIRDDAKRQLGLAVASLATLSDQSEAIAATEAHIADYDAIARQLAPWTAYDHAQEQVMDAQAEQARLSALIDECDAEQAQLLADSGIPVPGLSFAEDGEPLINGRSFSVASGAEKIGVAVAVALADNPQLRICLVDEATALDLDALQHLDELAHANDFQIWAVRLSDGPDGAGDVVIEDGSTVERIEAAVAQ